MKRFRTIGVLAVVAGCGQAKQPNSFLGRHPEGSEASTHADTHGPAAPDLVKRVYTYKKVGDLELQADVYRKSDFTVGPILLFIHGGALMGGERGAVPTPLQPLAKAGYVVVSIDHRLAPETKLGEIVEDVRDAVRWARGDGAHVFRGDPEKLAVVGVSSGAFLAQVTGYGEVRPRAIVSLWGYSDLAADSFTKPNQASLARPHISREDAFRDVMDHPITRRPPGRNAARLYLFCRQQGLFTDVVTGLDHQTQAAELEPFRPIRHVTRQFPPTMFVHGKEDKEVPYEQSANMATTLSRQGVPFELVIVPDAGHGLDGASDEDVTRIYRRVHEFVDRHLGVARED